MRIDYARNAHLHKYGIRHRELNMKIICVVNSSRLIIYDIIIRRCLVSQIIVLNTMIMTIILNFLQLISVL